MKSIPTASQTVGPFFSIGMEHLCQKTSAGKTATENKIVIRGTVFDGENAPIPDAVLEFWGPDIFARVATKDDGSFAASLDQFSAQSEMLHCVDVLIFMRGLLKPVLTRLYFGTPSTNDPVLKLVPTDRISTLFATTDVSPNHFVWNVIMQGDNETVFFDC